MDTEIELLGAPGEPYSSLRQEEDNIPQEVEAQVPETLFKVNEDGTVESEEIKLPETALENEDPEKIKDKPVKKEKPAPAPVVPETKKATKEVGDEEFYQAIGEKLAEWGAISKFDPEKFKSLDGLRAELEAEKEEYHKAQLDKLNPKQRKYLELSKEGVAEDVLEVLLERIDTFRSITSEELSTDKDLARDVYIEGLRKAGFSEARIKKYVQISEESNSLAEDAEESLSQLIEADEKALESEKLKVADKRAKAIKEKEEAEEKLKEAVFSIEAFVPGLPVNDKIKEAVYESITKEVGKTERGLPYNKVGKISSSNQAGFQALLHYYVHLGLFDQNKKGEFTPNLSKLQTYATTRVANTLDAESKVRKGLFQTSSGGEEPDGDESLIERLRRLKQS
jgi:DNA-binding transcriptional MerR regulator